jgi:metal transporter CNNM
LRCNRPTLRRILESGHSRLPVYRGSNRSEIIGLILVKELLAVVGLAEPGSGPVPVNALRMRDLPALPVETAMTDLLNLFQVRLSGAVFLCVSICCTAEATATVLQCLCEC